MAKLYLEHFVEQFRVDVFRQVLVQFHILQKCCAKRKVKKERNCFAHTQETTLTRGQLVYQRDGLELVLGKLDRAEGDDV